MLNVSRELNKRAIGPKMFAAFLNVSEKTAWNKMQGVTEFTISEALKTQGALFPEYTMRWLFSDEAVNS